ncbi:MAG: FG-GAP-like repeat-containing protein [Desulfuromonadales bacterium]
MKWISPGKFQVVVFSLLLSVIWLGQAWATAPVFKSLGQIREGLKTPTRIDTDALGNLYVADPGLGAVVKFDKYGRLVRSFGGLNVSGGGLAVSPDGTQIYVAAENSVAEVDGASGAVLGLLGSGPGEFEYVYDVDLDAAGYVVVADAKALKIKVYRPDRVFDYQFGSKGTGTGQFQMFTAMAVNPTFGEIYVADPSSAGTSWWPKVQVFNLAGVLQRTLRGSINFGSVAMTFFGGMAFDETGRGYFPDPLFGRINVLMLPSTYRSSYTSSGFGQGKLSGPKDSAYDPLTKRLLVLCEDGRIEIFGIDGGTTPVRINTIPAVPTVLSPMGDTVVNSARPQLSFQTVVDADGDLVSYNLQLFQGQTLAADLKGIAGSAGITVVIPASDLLENARYLWSVQASDGEGVSAWSAPQGFYVNAVAEAPSSPQLLAPLAGESLAGDGLLSWAAASDPDPFDSLSYRLEVAADAGFSTPVARLSTPATSQTLASLPNYADLIDGASYFWRVVAVDSQGLESLPGSVGQFTYDTTLIQITANMPGTLIYFGGNLGFAGRYVGEAPLELRDLPLEALSVVLERPGFEPFVAQLNPLAGENLSLHAVLVPVLEPVLRQAFPVQAGAAPIQLTGPTAPYAVDFNNDGLLDLVVGDSAGNLLLYRGQAAATQDGWNLAAAVSLGLPLIPGATPVVADWNNDGRKDLLVGAADGTVSLFLNQGSEVAPAFGAPSYLLANAAPISVGADAAPAVIDLNGDGRKDLVVGAADGSVWYFQNEGSDEAPVLTSVGALVALNQPVAPFFSDWNGDGLRELLLASGGQLLLCEQQADGRFVVGSSLFAVDEKPGRKERKSDKARNEAAVRTDLGDKLRVFVGPMANSKGKGVLAGNAAGELLWMPSLGTLPVTAFVQALGDKIVEITTLLGDQAVLVAPTVTALKADLDAGNFKAAHRQARALHAQVGTGTDIANKVAELVDLLK